ncbi:Ger(x)C family spore germination protein [Rossellomorea aquimaris]|uniref:Ger(X)C family spore germination protein n=1 Tax=Rossellomorea aquimaris TaxID=189382 RepID=A0A5D4TPH2_9BACI|nr:Ger(x)C family spore germination protein [Rossellomorea aquimaris]TYS75956.1 Ger(x)C family spore germination protein [Rossellomorea aquimaris]TYS81216.1 Ger(x)C family spore germination protein [Rossellomorea aquimaris]TYS89060.1 Ger(x)C family spore germination protein [Rossellomorea aquimaris]
MQRFFLFLVSITVFLTGCSNQRIIDRVQIIQVLGYDIHDDKVKGTVIYPTYEEQGKTVLHTLNTEADTFDYILENLNTKSSHPIDAGQLRTVLFSKDFAEQGIDPVIQFMIRDPIVGNRMQLGITEPLAENIIQLSVNQKVPSHLYDKINHNIKHGSLPKMNLHVFLSDFYSEGKDPFLPYFIIEDGEVKIDGLAIFKKSKYINHINLKQSFLLKMLKDGTKDGNYEAKIKEEDSEGHIYLRKLDSNVNYTINQIDHNPNISIDLTVKAQIKRVPEWLHLTKNKDIEKTEKMLEKHFNKEIQQLISVFQEYEADPIGMGDMMRASSRKWNYERYLSTYPDLKTTVNTHVKIIQTGVEE